MKERSNQRGVPAGNFCTLLLLSTAFRVGTDTAVRVGKDNPTVECPAWTAGGIVHCVKRDVLQINMHFD